MKLDLIPTAAKNFAHLINGRGTIVAKKSKAEDEEEMEDEKDEDEEDEGKKGKKADDKKEPPKDDKEDGKKASAKKAKDDKEDDEPCMEEDEEEEDEEEEEKNKKGKKEKAENGLDKATLARCETIFMSEHAAGRPDVACSLAFKSKLSAKEAINVMAAMGPVQIKGQRNGLGDKMSKVKNPDVGVDDASGGNQNEAATLAARIVAAGERATGK